MPEQIALDLSPAPDFSFETFQVGESNREAVTLVNSWPNWPSPILHLTGGEGTGKTHLGMSWARENDALIYLKDFEEISLRQDTCVFIDDAQDCDEVQLFSILNAALNGYIGGVLLASRMVSKCWDITLPDLRSRLVNVPVVTLWDHEDDILDAVIRRLFDSFGRSVKADVVQYLLNNQDRSIDRLKDIVKRLETRARAEKRDMTRAFVAGVLKHTS